MRSPIQKHLFAAYLLLAPAWVAAAEEALSPANSMELEFIQSQRDDLRAKAGTPVKELGSKYEAALTKMGEQARSAGKFPVVIATDESLKEFQQFGMPDGEASDPEVAKAEKIYLEQHAKLKTQILPAYVKLEKDYLDQLGKLATKLAEKNQAADAALLKKQVERQEAYLKRLESGSVDPTKKSTKVPGEMPASAVKIVKATYGTDEKSADVTKKIAEYVATMKDFSANPKGLGVDPHPYKNKRLTIIYEKDGKQREQKRGENETVLYESFAGPQDLEELDAWLAETSWEYAGKEMVFAAGKLVKLGQLSGTWTQDKNLFFISVAWDKGEKVRLQFDWRYRQVKELDGEKREFERVE